MKKINFIFLLTCIAITFTIQAQNSNSEKNNLALNKQYVTPVGSFSISYQTNAENTAKSSREVKVSELNYTGANFSTSDGGTATLFKLENKNVLTDQINSNEDLLAISVYPNPAMAEINILIQDEKAQSKDATYLVRIKNLFGQNIFEQKFEGKQFRIDSSHFAKGFFLVEVSNLDGKYCHTEKVVIQ